jgi:hypothetical protein
MISLDLIEFLKEEGKRNSPQRKVALKLLYNIWKNRRLEVF